MTDVPHLPETLIQALDAKGYDTLTPVQREVSAPELADKDLLVSAQTGSGKTVAFGLALAPTLLGDTGSFERASTPLALIIAPTRELAMQVRREFEWLYGPAGARLASTVGGMDARTERRALEKGAHIVVATPGRLRDHIARGAIDLSEVRAVVLDEADEMLDMGFSEDLEFILDHCPAERRTLLFSATVPKGIAKLAQTYQKPDTERLSVKGDGPQHADITYLAQSVVPSDIENGIINTLRFHEAPNAIVFCNTRAMVTRLTSRLSNRGFSVVALSGELSQSERTHALQALRDGRARVCVATDVAARGIDLPNLDLVIHADLPSNSETLLHRSGRTGRAGRKGISALVVPPRQKGKAERLLRGAKLSAEWGAPPSADDVRGQDAVRMLEAPVWQEKTTEADATSAQNLMERYSAEEIAAAFVRLYQAERSAPEELAAPQERGEKRKPRAAENFGPSTWFSLSLGRKQRAEPRWLLPMLCRNGGISKDDIGAIRVQYAETFVEVASAAIDTLHKTLGDTLDLEQGARLTQLEGVPDFDNAAKGPPADYAPKEHRKGGARSDEKKPYKARSEGKYEGNRGKDFGKKKDGDFGKKRDGDFPRKRDSDDKPYKAKPAKRPDGVVTKPKPRSEKPASKPEGKKPRKHDDGAKPAPKSKTRKGAADPSKPMGARKAGARKPGKAGKPGSPAREGASYKVKTRAGKGPDARPMRKPK